MDGILTAPGRYPLAIYRGDTYRWRFSLWLDKARSVPADLAGVGVKAEIRNRPGGGTIIPLKLTVEPPNGIVAELSAAASRQVPLQAFWDLELSFANGDIVTVASGPVIVTMDITNSTLPLVVA